MLFFTLSCMFRQKKRNIIFFGDSITKNGTERDGFITMLRQMLDSNQLPGAYKLVASGINGNKIKDLYTRMDNDVLAKNPSIVIIWIGVNDVWHKLSGNGTSADQFANIYSDVIKRLQAQNIKVMLVTPSVIGEKKNGVNPQDNDLDLYANIIHKLSDQYKCKLIDMRKAFAEYENENNPDNNNSGILTVDGVHLSKKGNALAAEKIMQVLAPVLKSTISD